MKNALLISPWIYDFSAYDLWIQPVGLLKLSTYLKKKGFNTSLINTLDRFDKELIRFLNKNPKNDKYFCGQFHKEKIEKPKKVRHINRNYYRYGYPLKLFHEKLKKIGKPDIIFITSGMTYWYSAIFDTIEICKQYFPSVPIVLGGTYSSLMTEHAEKHSKANYVSNGKDKLSINGLELDFKEIMTQKQDRELLTNRKVHILQTSYGCPFKCSYCASHCINDKYIQRNIKDVFDEITESIKKYKTRHFVFYDDALLVNSDNHIKLFLEKYKKLKYQAFFHTPNGLHTKFIDKDIAKLFLETKFKTIRLSLETSDEKIQKKTGNKVSNIDLKKAVENLVKAGFKGKDIDVYVMIGLPGQSLKKVFSDIMYVHNLGIKIFLANYSPIPGTKDFDKLVKKGLIKKDEDPLLFNNSIFIQRIGYDLDKVRRLRNIVSVLNFAVENGLKVKEMDF